MLLSNYHHGFEFTFSNLRNQCRMILEIFWTVLTLILTLKNDFMAADAKVVDVGSSVILRCPSKAKIRKCFFSRGDGDVRYRIRSGKKFENGRIQCLCDVSIINTDIWKAFIAFILK